MNGYVGGKKGRWHACQRPLCVIQFVKCFRPSPKTLISCGFAGVSLCEAGSLFELFYRKTAPLRSASIETTGFSENVRLRFLLENAENRYRKIYPGSHFRHRFLIKPASFPARKVPRIGLATYMPVSDGALGSLYKSTYSATLFRKSASDE